MDAILSPADGDRVVGVLVGNSVKSLRPSLIRALPNF